MSSDEDNQPRYTTARLHAEIRKAKAHARREALEEAATLIDEAWRHHGGMNCTQTCAIVRALVQKETV